MQTEQLKGGMFLWLIVECFAQFIVGEVDYKQNALNLFRSILPWSNSASCKCRWLRQTADYPLSNYPGSHTTTDDDENDDDMTFHNPNICAFRPNNEETQNQEKTIHYPTIQALRRWGGWEKKRRGELRPWEDIHVLSN